MGLIKRGAIRPTTIAEAIERARSMIGYVPELPPEAPEGIHAGRIWYELDPPYNGGGDPLAEHPAEWNTDREHPCFTCDCVGFVAWALGFDRFQEHRFSPGRDGRVIYGGWINTDAMVIEAKLRGRWFEIIDTPELGCLAVTRSTRDPNTGKRIRVGHVGMVTGLCPEWDPALPTWGELKITHCSKSNAKNTGGAIQETDGSYWGRKAGVLLRYLKAKAS